MGLLFRTDWTGVDKTNKNARPIVFEAVSSTKIIHVARADFRGATLENVWFEISASQKAIRPYEEGSEAASLPVKVVCLWFGRFPPKERFITIKVEGKYITKEAAGEEVVRDIGT